MQFSSGCVNVTNLLGQRLATYLLISSIKLSSYHSLTTSTDGSINAHISTESIPVQYINGTLLSRVHNISREGECLTAYTCFKRTASSTKSTPPGVN